MIIIIKVEDRDEGENGWLMYKFIYGVEDMFEIDGDTGVIRFIKFFDFEIK